MRRVSWPNSSLSSSPVGMAAQFTLTNVRSRRWLRLWMARAISSLPVPLSPRISTVESVGATVSTSRSTRFQIGLSPMISSKSYSRPDLVFQVQLFFRQLVLEDRRSAGTPSRFRWQ